MTTTAVTQAVLNCLGMSVSLNIVNVRFDLRTSSQSNIDMQLFELSEPLCPDY